MKRRTGIGAVIVCLNLPWAVLWWYFSRPGETNPGSIQILFLLLIVGVTCMVVIPSFLVGDFFPRRWLLILTLAFVNLFWFLRWIEAFNTASPNDPAYRVARLFFLVMIVLSSSAVVAMYTLVGRLLDWRYRR
jgi:hypothetical protein